MSNQGIHTCCREYLTPLAKERVEESKEPMQSAKIPDKAEPMEPITEPDVATSMFGTHSPRQDLRDGLSKLIGIMQHM
ncbi:hypothetical protein J1N35_014309 [Gossypium stocksii]|uniref:Uncharacterized protein n=1 Tax=Gossypium stocksii TaxID=47602 RepID=A0A9D3VV62_9ROSI|nr:hypothetical protein J1N35_014309 [Gossypium stocksii]